MTVDPALENTRGTAMEGPKQVVQAEKNDPDPHEAGVEASPECSSKVQYEGDRTSKRWPQHRSPNFTVTEGHFRC